MSSVIAKPGIVFHRFAWKEYRMLRGFWLAVLVMGVVEQWVSTLLLDAGPMVPGWLFASAWGAAALYAVGAAVTLFGAENEERTSEFLQILPTPWQPMFLAKVAAAAVTALLLAGVLCLTGWLLAGRVWPTTAAWQMAFGVGGVAVVEATVWGLLFSLLWRQPLLAAVAALGAASLGAQLAIGVTPNTRHYFTAQSYYTAIPARLLLCLGVFALDVVVGQRWLQPHSRRGRITKPIERALAATASPATVVADGYRPRRRRMFARLLWQTWREAWRPMLAAVPLAVFLMVALLMPMGLATGGSYPIDLPMPMLVALFLPALFGALVFRADQRDEHRLFLTAHGASPRNVWWTRQFVWLGSLLLVAVAVQLAVAVVLGNVVSGGLMRYLRGDLGYNGIIRADRFFFSDWTQAWDYHSTRLIILRGTVLGWCALFTAYACGQCCSMLLKREVLAGFLALLASAVLAAWSMVVMFWRLNPIWFVMPLGLGAMLATWLRVPDWIVGRRKLRRWLLPGLAIVLPATAIAWALPGARLAQLNFPRPVYPLLKEPLGTSLARLEESRTVGEQTALEYERVNSNLEPWPNRDDLTVDGMQWGTLKESSETVGEALTDRFDQAHQQQYAEVNQPAIKRLLELTQEPHCRLAPFSGAAWGYMQTLTQLLVSDAERLTKAGELESALERLCAWVRIEGHRRQAQPAMTWAMLRNNYNTSSGYYAILDWAHHEKQTSERLLDAIPRLRKCFAMLPDPREAILAEWQFTRDILLEKQLPTFMRRDHQAAMNHLAYLANKLSGEQERALQALNYLTENTLNYVDAVTQATRGDIARLRDQDDLRSLRELVQVAPYRGRIATSEFAFRRSWKFFSLANQAIDQCQTSYLLQKELDQNRNFSGLLDEWVAGEIRQRALALQLALLAYRLDHGVFPKKLAKLTPDYLPEIVLDPFSGKSFGWAPEGYELPVDRWYRNREHIPPRTPLLWSVGNANSTPQEREDEGQAVIRFVFMELTGHPRGAHVFPLSDLRQE